MRRLHLTRAPGVDDTPDGDAARSDLPALPDRVCPGCREEILAHRVEGCPRPQSGRIGAPFEVAPNQPHQLPAEASSPLLRGNIDAPDLDQVPAVTDHQSAHMRISGYAAVTLPDVDDVAVLEIIQQSQRYLRCRELRCGLQRGNFGVCLAIRGDR